MKKTLGLLLIFSCLGFCNNIKAQNYSTSIGFNFYPGLTTVYNSPASEVRMARFSKSYGLMVRKSILNNYLYLESGIQLLDRGFGDEVNALDPTNYTWSVESIREVAYFATAPLTLLVNYKGFYGGGGASFGYLAFRRFMVDGELKGTDRSYYPQQYTIGAQILLGYETEITDHLLLSMEASAMPGVSISFFNVSFGLGLKYAR